VNVVGAAVLSTDDVVNRVGQDGSLGWEAAVFAGIRGAPADQFAGFAGNCHEAARTVDRSSA
jgi:hypothetical protein